jgi:hypothetical protein
MGEEALATVRCGAGRGRDAGGEYPIDGIQLSSRNRPKYVILYIWKEIDSFRNKAY